jgi:hypothetical protein
VQNEVLLEELTMAIEAPAPAPALYSAPPDGQASSGGQAPRTSSTKAPARPPTVALVATRPAAPPTEAVAPTRADAGVATPPAEVPPAWVVSRAGRRSTTHGPKPSPCGRVRPQVPPVLRHRLS